jgi:hypothetical protein
MSTWEKRMTPRALRESRLELLETCWRFIGPSKKVFECGIYRTDAGLEVRAGYGPDDLLRSQFVIEIGAAREIAGEWRQAVADKGGFEEVSMTSAS